MDVGGGLSGMKMAFFAPNAPYSNHDDLSTFYVGKNKSAVHTNPGSLSQENYRVP